MSECHACHEAMLLCAVVDHAHDLLHYISLQKRKLPANGPSPCEDNHQGAMLPFAVDTLVCLEPVHSPSVANLATTWHVRSHVLALKVLARPKTAPTNLDNHDFSNYKQERAVNNFGNSVWRL